MSVTDVTLSERAIAQHAPVAAEKLRFDPRTRALIEGPIAATLVRLAAPNVLVMLAQTSVGLVETYFIGKLGTAALAGVALVFPLVMLMQMMSAGAMGGGISSAIARALGGGRRADADALALHATVIALVFGIGFTLALLAGGRALYAAMGGSGASLNAALTYSNVVFAGAVLVWLFNSLANVIRGSGNMMVPAAVTCAGVVVLIPLSPCLIFGLGPLPRLGVAGGAVAVLIYYAVGSIVLAGYLRTPRSIVHLAVKGVRLRWPLFADILRVGLVAALITVATNLTIAFATALVAAFGPAAIAGYGVGSRLEYLLIPLVFGLGGPLVAMVGTSIGAGRRERALRVAWIGAAIAAALCEFIGCGAALFPRAWLALFDSDPAMIEAGSRYLQVVGPVYGLFGLGMALYFASQGAGRLLWPLLANFARLLIASAGGLLALRWTGSLTAVFVALSAALATFGLINAAAVARGAWFTTKPVGAMTVQYFEDYAVGQIYHSGPHRIDKAQIIAFAKQFDPQPYHLDEEAAKQSPFKGLAASGWHTAAITMRLLVDGEFKPAGGILGVGFDQLSWPRPVRPGDELRVTSEVLELRPSKSRPDRGLVRAQNTTFNQNDEPVQIFTANLIVPRRSPSAA
jgi:putative MATE family efflux protein